MTRAQLIAALTDKYRDVSPLIVDRSVREILELLSETLVKGDRIEVRGFGSFEVRIREPRTAHNPKTGDKVELSQRRVVHFKPGVELRHRVNRVNGIQE